MEKLGAVLQAVPINPAADIRLEIGFAMNTVNDADLFLTRSEECVWCSKLFSKVITTPL